jgi:hypothetical protein
MRADREMYISRRIFFAPISRKEKMDIVVNGDLDTAALPQAAFLLVPNEKIP